MTPYLFWELLFLGIGVWVLALILVIYAWLLLQRQKRLAEMVMEKLDRMSPKEESKEEPEAPTLNDLRPAPSVPEEKTIVISKDEPIGKYEHATVDDSVNVSFVEAHHDEDEG